MKSLLLRVFVVVLLIVFVQNVQGRHYYRIKRVSDQRLAELETQIALSKMRGQLVTVPLGFGSVDPKQIGRKRRSDSRILDALFNQTSEEDTGDPRELVYEDIYRKRR